MTQIRWGIVASALCLGQTALGSIVNGGFEAGPGGAANTEELPGGSTVIPGWITTNTGVEWFLPSAFSWPDSPNGGRAVDLANTTHTAGGIEQTLATVAGTLYQIDFLYGTSQRFGRVGTAEIIVAAGGTSQTFSIANSGSNIVWEPRSFSFIASSASTALSFRNFQNAGLHFAFIDGVTASIVPAPGAAFMALIAGIGTLSRRTR